MSRRVVRGWTLTTPEPDLDGSPTLLVIAGTLEAQSLLNRQKFDAVVSVALDWEGGTERPSNLPTTNVLKLQVNDISDQVLTHCDPKEEFLFIPEREHAEAIVAFARLHAHSKSILVHCAAGWSRSPAAAIVMFATWLGRGAEAEAVQCVMGAYKCTPNDRIIRLGDEVLELNGALVREFNIVNEAKQAEFRKRYEKATKDPTFSIWDWNDED